MDSRISKKKKFEFRELTKNEKFLLTLLGIILFSWISYRFVFTPQLHKLKTLSEQRIEYEDKILAMNETLRKEEQINKDWDILHKEKEQIVSRYFPRMDQAQIIYLLNDLIENEDLSVVDLNFNRPNYEDIGGFQVRNMGISIPYNGGYLGIIDMINSIKSSPRKILVDSLSMDRDSTGTLNGNMSLKIYSLEGIAESGENVVYIDTVERPVKDTPFSSYADFSVDENSKNLDDKDSTEIKPYIEETLLDFENKNSYFLPSQPLVKGSVSQSTNAKSKKYSLRFEYNIIAIEEENRAYIDISKNNVVLKYPPNTIGLWVYAYDYSPATLGLGFNGQMGERLFWPISEGIGWTGWKYIEVSPPSDLNLYPLKLDKLYLEIPKDREDFGVLLLDKLEGVYVRNLGEDGSDKSASEFIFHIVKPGDTIHSIGMEYYGTSNYKDEIFKLNEIKPGELLPVGKVLVLKKR